MDFIFPYWLICLLLIPVLIAGYAVAVLRPKGKGKTIIAERLQQKWRQQKSLGINHLGNLLHILALGLVIISVARPYSGEKVITVASEGHNIFILFDTSTSMLSRDMSPSRIEAAHAAAITVLKAFPESNIGVATFDESLTLYSPSSQDHDAIIKDIRSCLPDPEYPSGSDLGRAVTSSLEMLKSVAGQNHTVIIFSDGEKHVSEMDDAMAMAKAAAIPIFTVGVGTPTGGTIPNEEQQDKKFRDKEGKIVYTKLESEVLTQLANASDGTYTSLYQGNMKQLIQSINATEESSGRAHTLRVPDESYHYFLLTAFVFLIAGSFAKVQWLAFKVGPVALLLTLCYLSSSNIQAKELSYQSLKQEYLDKGLHLRDGRSELNKKQYEQAIETFKKSAKITTGDERAEIYFAMGDAAFRAGQYNNAQAAFSKALLHTSTTIQTEASYNLGNSLFFEKWNKLKPEGEISFKEHIKATLLQIKRDPKAKPPFSQSDISTASTQWSDSVKFHRYAHQLNPSHANAEQNAATIKKLIEDLDTAEQEAEKQHQEEKKEEQDKQDKPDGKQKGDSPSDESDPDKGEPKEPGDKGEGGDKGKPKDDPNSDEPGDENQQDGDPDSTNLKKNKNESAEAYAKRVLESLSDEQRNPLKRAPRRPYRSEFDW